MHESDWIELIKNAKNEEDYYNINKDYIRWCRKELKIERDISPFLVHLEIINSDTFKQYIHKINQEVCEIYMPLMDIFFANKGVIQRNFESYTDCIEYLMENLKYKQI